MTSATRSKWTIFMLIAIFFGLIAIGFLQGKQAKTAVKHEAMLNEYEYVLADVWAEKESCWAEKEDCKDQLGVFYKE